MSTYPSHKVCNKCKEEKPLTAFYKHRGGKYERKGFCAVCERARTAAWRKQAGDAHKQAARSSYISRKYNLTVETFNQMRVEQNHKCAICGVDELEVKFGKLYIDHNHDTGKVRQLLCHYCNTGLGMFKDDIDTLLAAVAYLQENT